MTDYTPIDCGSYSQYELAILRGTRMRISWREPSGQLHIETLTPRDLVTRDHGEYLIAESGTAAMLELRLDYIFRTEAL